MAYTPWSNTVVYYPLTSTSTVNDSSWNWHTLNNYNVTFWELQWVDCWKWSATSSAQYLAVNTISATNYTINYWIIVPDVWTSYQTHYYMWGYWYVWCRQKNDNLYFYASSWSATTISWVTTDKWHNIVVTKNWSSWVIYIDWVQKATMTANVWINTSGTWFNIWWWQRWHIYLWWWMSNFIIENKARTQEEVTSYFNSTKWNYGYFVPDYLHRDTQWPCWEGYHVPTKWDWESLSTILQWWFADKWYWRVSEYLKLPLWTWWISVSSAEITSSWFSMYWTSTLWEKQAYVFNVEKLSSSTSSIRVAEYYTAIWTFIRPFKNIPVVPDWTWSTLYTSWNWWIYWNAGLWLISISWDWKTWATIADKNLWATTVASYTWSTVSWSLSQCWYYYQWWNNNWFEYTYPLPYSSNQVNASWYWPWNHYNKSTYIKYIQNDDYWIWDSSHNASLWWWDTDRRPLPPANKYITKLYHLWKEYIFDERVSNWLT